MYPGSILLFIGGAALLILLVALLLSIIVFSTKSVAVEVIAWILGGLWLLLDQAIVYSGMFDNEGISNYFFYPVLLIFFLLLQYRSNAAQGNNLRMLYIAKTVLVVLFLGTVNAQIINQLGQNGLLNYEEASARWILPAAGMLISVSLITYITFLYLQRIHAAANKNDIFKSAIIFTAASYFFADILGHLLFFIQYHKLLAEVPGFTFFTPQQLATQMAYFIVETLLTATIAAYIYKSKQEATA
ncbi:hypothetical protein [Chitinophaga sp.]|uniref:hypothetical protein n=1 Tax=Chitinophaga sp. TaxID=1869181 RepID=UPI002F93050F